MSRGASPIRVFRARGDSFTPQAARHFHRRKLWRMLACTFAGAALGLVYVWQHIHTNLLGYRLREIELHNTQLRVDIAQLRNDIAQLSAPARIDGYARQELGMVRQGTWDLVLLDDPDVPMSHALAQSPTFWSVQGERWARLAQRVHDSLGPGQAMAAPEAPLEVGTDNEAP